MIAELLKQFPADTTLEVHLNKKRGRVATLRSVIRIASSNSTVYRESIATGPTLWEALDRVVVEHIATLLVAEAHG